MVIGDGFGPPIVEALLTVLAEDVRFRDLPIAVLGGHPDVIEEFYPHLPNLDRVTEGPERLVARFLPFVRLHAFGQRLKRMLKSLDANGTVSYTHLDVYKRQDPTARLTATVSGTHRTVIPARATSIVAMAANVRLAGLGGADAVQ